MYTSSVNADGVTISLSLSKSKFKRWHADELAEIIRGVLSSFLSVVRRGDEGRDVGDNQEELSGLSAQPPGPKSGGG